MIAGQSYTIEQQLLSLFDEKNTEALQNAQITAIVEKGKVVEVQSLTIRHAGTVDGGNTIVGEVIVDADAVKLTNLQVTGNVILTENVLTAFDVEKVKMDQLLTAEKPRIAQLVVAATPRIAQQVVAATRLKITFADSTVAFVEIRQENVLFSLADNAKITSLVVKADKAIIDSPTSVLPSVKIIDGVTKIELNASITNVEIDSTDDLEVTGKGNFNQVAINSTGEVKLATEGTIKSLNANDLNVSLGMNVKVEETKLQGQTVQPEEIIKNIDEVKDNVNVVVPDEDKGKYLVAKLMPVEGRFGYFTLALTNVDDAIIKHELVPDNGGVKIAADGTQAPSTATVYNEGDQFISYFLNDIHVYKTDENNVVLDSFVLDKSNVDVNIQSTRIEGDTLVMKSIFDEQLRLEYIYGATEQHFTFQNEQILSVKDEDGIPTITLKLDNDVALTENSAVRLHMYLEAMEGDVTKGGWRTQHSQQNKGDFNATKLNLVKSFVKNVTLNTLNEWDYYYELDKQLEPYIAYGTAPSTLPKFVLAKAVEQINSQDPQSLEELTLLGNQLYTDSLPMIEKLVSVGNAIDALYKENRYLYPELERLREGVTQADLDAAQQLVDDLGSILDAADLQLDLNTAKNIFEQLNAKEDRDVLTFTNSSSVSNTLALPSIVTIANHTNTNIMYSTLSDQTTSAVVDYTKN